MVKGLGAVVPDHVDALQHRLLKAQFNLELRGICHSEIKTHITCVTGVPSIRCKLTV